jgi:outer membrane protein assembly factor BamB
MLGAGTAHAADWLQYRGINRDGISAETEWLQTWPPTEVWRKTVGVGYSSCAVSDGRVYTIGGNSSTGTIYCFDAYNGSLIWSNSYEDVSLTEIGTLSTPTVDGNNVYVFSKTADIYCFNKVTGALRWSQLRIGQFYYCWGAAGSPLVDGNLLILNAGGGVALDKNTGSNVWSNVGTGGFGSPKAISYNGQRIVLIPSEGFPHGGGVDSSSCGIDELTGVALSNWDFGIFYGEDAEFYGTNKFCCGNALYQIGSGGLTALWSNGGMGFNAYSARLIVGDYLYGFNDCSNGLSCVSLADGSLKWCQELGQCAEGALIASDGKIIMLTGDGQLIICKADPTGYNLEGRTPYQMTFEPYLGGSPSGPRACPVLANGLMYLRDYGSYSRSNYCYNDCEADLVCLSFAIDPAFAYTTNSDNTITITGYTGTNCTVQIPIIINGMPVTSIGSNAFQQCAFMGNVLIPNTVTNIGYEAFAQCGNLRSITIPDSVINIEEFAFANCGHLTSVTINNNATIIGVSTFYICGQLHSFYVKGNAPNLAHYRPCDTGITPTIFYLPGTTGWSTNVTGVSTALWLPQICCNPTSCLQSNQFGFNVNWASGMVAVVETCTNLAAHSWCPVQTNVLASDAFYFSDSMWTNNPSCFYRIVWQ